MWATLLLCVACGLACDPSINSASGFFVLPNSTAQTTDGSECTPFSSLSQAIAAISSRTMTVLSLLKGDKILRISDLVTLDKSLEIKGNREIIEFGATFAVKANGDLTISNATLKAIGTSMSVLFSVQGRVRLEDINISESAVALFVIESGSIEIAKSSISRNTAPAISLQGWNSKISLNQVSVYQHFGVFLSLYPKSGLGTSQIDIISSAFLACVGTPGTAMFGMNLAADGSGTFAKVLVDSSDFRYSNITVFDFNIVSTEVSITNSLFRETSGLCMHVNQISSQFEVHNLTWNRNSGMMLQGYQQYGHTIVDNCSVSEQMNTGLILIDGSDLTTCYFFLLNSRLSHTNIKSSNGIPGIIWGRSCSVTVSNVSIEDFTLYDSNMDNNRGLFVIESGAILIESLNLARSGTASQVITTINTAMFIRDSLFVEMISVQGHVIVAIIGQITVKNSTFRNFGISSEPSMQPHQDWPSFLLWTQMHAEFSDITFDNQTFIMYASMFAGSHSTYTMSRIRVNDIRADIMIAMVGCIGTISDLRLRNVTFNSFMIQLFAGSIAALDSLSVRNITVIGTGKGVLCVSNNCVLNATKLELKDINADIVLLAMRCVADMRNASFVNMNVTSLVGSTVASVVTISDVRVKSSSMGWVQGSETTFTFEDCIFEDIGGLDMLLYTYSTDVTFRRTVVKRLFSQTRLGKILEGSQLFLENCDFDTFGSLEGEGLTVSESAVNVRNTSFVNFNSTLFQGVLANFSLTEVTFHGGIHVIDSTVSSSAYGTILGCIGCYTVTIDHISAFNISAFMGGALSFRRLDEVVDGNVTIRNSEFTLCSAHYGGAIYMQNISFIIEDCSFVFNKADVAGGAIDMSIRVTDNRIIKNSVLRGNNATEGGAIKWRNAEVQLINVQFIDNYATYGPNLASYGARLSERLTNLTGAEVSGQPLLLMFEILDHYGSRVTTSSNSVLKLQESESVTFRGNQAAISNKGVFTYYELTIFAPPGTQKVINAVMEETEDNLNLRFNGNIFVSFRNCTPGEIYRSNMCELCNAGNVSFSIEDTECTLCPKNAFCSGGNNLTVNPSYWRSSSTSITVIDCPLPDKCLGGPNSTCAPDFTGKLCTQCDKGRYRYRITECTECGSDTVLGLQLAAIPCFMLLFMFAVVKYAVNEPDDIKLFIVKAVVNHAQLLSTMTPFKVTYPTLINNSLRVIAYMSSLMITDLPIVCFGFSSPEYIRVSIASIVVVIMVLSSLMFLALTCQFSFKALAVLTTSYLLFTPAIVIQALVPLLACQKTDNEEKYLFLDMDQKCWEGTHASLVYYMLVPSLLINIVFPIVFALIAKWKWPHVFSVMFPMWRVGYRWEFWDLFSTISKCVCLWFMLNSITYAKLGQVAYGLIALIIYCVLNVSLSDKVYKTSLFFYISESSDLIVTLSLSLGSYYIYNVPENSKSDLTIESLFLTLNVGFFAGCVCFLLWGKKAMPILSNESVMMSVSLSIDQMVQIKVPDNSILGDSRGEGEKIIDH